MISNVEVLQQTQEKDMYLYNSIVKHNMAYVKPVRRGSSVDNVLQILEGKVNGEMYQGRLKRLWLGDLKEWAKLETYTDIKRTTEEEVSGDYMHLRRHVSLQKQKMTTDDDERDERTLLQSS